MFLASRLYSDLAPSMSQSPQHLKESAMSGGNTTLANWLRQCLKRHRTMVAFGASTVAVVSVAALFPSELWLSAAQFSPVDGNSQSSNAVAQEIEISPRSSGANANIVPFQQRDKPQADRSRGASTRNTNRKTVQGQRAVLQTPIFGDDVAAGSQDSRPDSATPLFENNQHGSQDTSRPVNPDSGFNFVRASGVDALPYSGAPNPLRRNGGVVSPPVSSRATPTTWQENVGVGQAAASEDGPLDAAFSLPQTSGQISPASPVPAAPMRAAPNSSEYGQIPNSVLPPNHIPPNHIPPNHIPPTHIPSTNVPPTNSPVHIYPGDPQPGAVVENHDVIQEQRTIQPPRGTGRFVPGPMPGTSGFRASVESDAPRWIGPYVGRTGQLPSGVEQSPTPAPSVSMPSNYSAWWDSLVQQHAGIAPRTLSVDVTSLVQQALAYSPQVQVLQADPEVQQRVVKQEEAAFDWSAFLDAKYDDLNDPVGNTLTTGNNSNRFTDSHVYSSGGLKRRTNAGGELKLAQQFGYQDNNSRFLLPNPQATSRLELSFRQPLLNHAGTVYNQSQIILARIGANSSGDETLEELQKHLYSVAETYWRLYRARAEFFQRQKVLASAQHVLVTLEARQDFDTTPRQILPARAAVARAESRMQRAVTEIRNAESQLRLLVNDPEMLDGGPVEFTPMETPSLIPSPVGLRESLQTALINRPDISYAIRQMRASGVRMGVSKTEMLPKLDFIVSSYVAGLERNAQFSNSFSNQFNQGQPGYTVGLEFEVPLGNRAAKAKMEQRQWELKRAINSFRATVETSLTEVEIAAREVDTSWRELLGKYQAMAAAQNEVSYLQDRFEKLAAPDESSTLLLEDLLDGYERLADEEASFVQSQTNYALSIIQLRRATGTMLRSRHDAPELENTESDWMASRADQAATELDSKATRTASMGFPSPPLTTLTQQAVLSHQDSLAQEATLAPSSSAVPSPVNNVRRDKSVSFNRPISGRPDAVAAPQPRPVPKVGGHSFGNGF